MNKKKHLENTSRPRLSASAKYSNWKDWERRFQIQSFTCTDSTPENFVRYYKIRLKQFIHETNRSENMNDIPCQHQNANYPASDITGDNMIIFIKGNHNCTLCF